MVVYLPSEQGLQMTSSLYVPAAHASEQTWASLAALLANFPDGHVWSVHIELPVLVEYFPDAHAAQNASANVVPITEPWPAVHSGVECGLHAALLFASSL